MTTHRATWDSICPTATISRRWSQSLAISIAASMWGVDSGYLARTSPSLNGSIKFLIACGHDQGHIKLTDGNTIDYDFVKAQILEIAAQCNLIKLFTDPYNAKKLAEELMNNDGLPVEYLRQGYLSLSDPTKTLHELIMGRKIRHGGNPILRWHASNAVARKRSGRQHQAR